MLKFSLAYHVSGSCILASEQDIFNRIGSYNDCLDPCGFASHVYVSIFDGVNTPLISQLNRDGVQDPLRSVYSV